MLRVLTPIAVELETPRGDIAEKDEKITVSSDNRFTTYIKFGATEC